MEFLAQRVEGNLEILEHRIGLGLVVERLLVRAANRVLGHVIDLSDGGGAIRADQILALARDQQRLHEALRLAVVEEVAALRLLTQFDDATFPVERDVAQRAQRNVNERVVLCAGLLVDGQGKGLELPGRLFAGGARAFGARRFAGFFLGSIFLGHETKIRSTVGRAGDTVVRTPGPSCFEGCHGQTRLPVFTRSGSHVRCASESVGQVEGRDLPPVENKSAALHLPYSGSSRYL